MDPNILIIVPAYNASKYLHPLLDRIRPYFDDSHILVINDGSADDTGSIVNGLSCHKISYTHNRGKGAALKLGFAFAVEHGFDAVITIDADLQHLPEHLPQFCRLYDAADILIGTRTINPKVMPLDRMVTNNLTSLIISVFGTIRMRDSQSGYRLIKRPVLEMLRLTSDRYDTESEMLFQSGYLGFTTGEVPIDTVYEGSHSFINPFKDTTRFIRQIWRRLWY